MGSVKDLQPVCSDTLVRGEGSAGVPREFVGILKRRGEKLTNKETFK
jgi:hypothetical protein